MHIPASMLHGAVCPVTVAVGVASTGLAAYAAFKAEEKPSAAKFAAVTSMVFALQMLNYPVQDGTSGHLVGGLLAVALMGIPFSVLAMAIVLAVQAVFFGDGGINALGANIFNMGVLGAALAGTLMQILKKKGVPQHAALSLAAWFSAVAGAISCSFQVAWSGAVELNKALPAMVSVHALIGVGEALLTVLVVGLVTGLAGYWKAYKGAIAFASFSVAIVAAMLSPFASAFPDGLERVAGKLSFAEFPAASFTALFPDYSVPAIGNGLFSTILAGLIGVMIVSAVCYLVAKTFNARLLLARIR
jgi:cobalt/nickel transport system permease protein